MISPPSQIWQKGKGGDIPPGGEFPPIFKRFQPRGWYPPPLLDFHSEWGLKYKMNLFQIPAKICLRCGAYCVHTFTFFQSSFLLFLNQEPTFRCLLEVVRFRFSLFCVSPIHNSFTNFAVFVDTIPCSACLCVFRELSLSASILRYHTLPSFRDWSSCGVFAKL